MELEKTPCETETIQQMLSSSFSYCTSKLNKLFYELHKTVFLITIFETYLKPTASPIYNIHYPLSLNY